MSQKIYNLRIGHYLISQKNSKNKEFLKNIKKHLNYNEKLDASEKIARTFLD